MRNRGSMPPAILFGLAALLVLSACARQPTAAAPTPTTLAATPAPTTQASVTPDPSSDPSALAERALKALEALDREEGFQLRVSTDSLVRQQVSQNGTVVSNGTSATTYMDQGTLSGKGNSRSIRLQRAAYFPGSQNIVPMEGEARLVSGVLYARGTYKGIGPAVSPFPTGWVKINGPASSLYWSAFQDLFMPDLAAAMRADAGALLTGRPTQQVRAVVSANLARAERAEGKLEDGSVGEIITLTLKTPAVKDSLMVIDVDDPLNQAIFKAAPDEPVTLRFTLDGLGRLIRFERSVQVDVKDLDLSLYPGGQPGMRLTLTGTQSLSARILPLDASIPAVTAPEEGQMAKPISISTRSEEKSPVSFTNLNEFDARLNVAIASGELDSFWKEIAALGRMPLIFGDTAVFLYRGDAKTVSWNGDWNGIIPMVDKHLGNTGIWMCAGQFPLDARLEYQLVVDGGKGVVDPLNPLSEVGGLATKSVLRMPEYAEPAFTTLQDGAPQGKLTENLTLSSASLGYDVNYRVYTPAEYPQSGRLPAIYITDGQDYLKFGRMQAILDNLIAEKKIQPVVAVFIDPRDTKTGDNLREKQFLDNPKYADFIAHELVPAVEKAYKLDPSPDARAILGASYGGYFSASFALRHADQFHLIGIQSPAFWYNPAILDEYKKAALLPLKIFMNTGVMNDTQMHARLMRDVLQAKGYSLRYVESNEGHSYGNWRGKMDQLLVFFFGK